VNIPKRSAADILISFTNRRTRRGSTETLASRQARARRSSRGERNLSCAKGRRLFFLIGERRPRTPARARENNVVQRNVGVRQAGGTPGHRQRPERNDGRGQVRTRTTRRRDLGKLAPARQFSRLFFSALGMDGRARWDAPRSWEHGRTRASPRRSPVGHGRPDDSRVGADTPTDASAFPRPTTASPHSLPHRPRSFQAAPGFKIER
jgi:hypothetical protein